MHKGAPKWGALIPCKQNIRNYNLREKTRKKFFFSSRGSKNILHHVLLNISCTSPIDTTRL